MKSKASSRRSSNPVTCSAKAVAAPVTPLDLIYQQQILQHNRHPVGYRQALPQTQGWHRARVYNPLCGDEIELAARLQAATEADDAMLQELAFTGESCAICTASASLLCQQTSGLTARHAAAMARQFHQFVHDQQPLDDEQLQVLAIFAQLHSLPNRKTCATLPWQALQDVLANHRALEHS